MRKTEKPVICNVEKRYLFMREIEKSTVSQVKNAVRRLCGVNKEHPISVFISSNGGFSEACFEIYHFLRKVEVPIITIGAAPLRSAAFVLLQAGRQRLLVPGTKPQFHRSECEFFRGARLDMFGLMDLFFESAEIDATQLNIFLERGNSFSKIRKLFYRNARVSTKEALELNLIDGIFPRSNVPRV